VAIAIRSIRWHDSDQAAAIDSHLTILSQEQDEAILREAIHEAVLA
jgi:hypothetical protein